MRNPITFLFLLLPLLAIADVAPPLRVVNNFVYFGRERERLNDPGFLATAKLEGAQVAYSWREIEQGEDGYNFEDIQSDLDFLTAHGKKLWIQLQDATFDPNFSAVPKYLINRPEFHGGETFQYGDDGVVEGHVGKRWDPAVQDRLAKLFVALGAAFDGKVVGINLPETAVGVSEEGAHAEPGFTYAGYRDAIQANLLALKKAFPNSIVMQYANFMPGEWLPDDDHSYLRSIYEYAVQIGAAVGAPDLMPERPSQQHHAYKFMNEFGDKIKVGIAVQDGNYSGTTGEHHDPGDSWPDLVPGLFNYARDFLKTDYIFWGAEEPFFSKNTIPFFTGP